MTPFLKKALAALTKELEVTDRAGRADVFRLDLYRDVARMAYADSLLERRSLRSFPLIGQVVRGEVKS